MKRILLLVLLFTHAFITVEGMLLARTENFLRLEKEAKAETADEAELASFIRETPGVPERGTNLLSSRLKPRVHQALMVSSDAPVLSVPFFILHGGLRT